MVKWIYFKEKARTVIAYLSGAMEFASDEGAGWRKDMTKWLDENLPSDAVIIAEISSGGVTSNAGLITSIPSGAVFLSPIPVTSLAFLCSIITSSGLLLRSNVDNGAAT